MPTIDKKHFLKTVTILYDTREQKNKHILDALAAAGIPTEQRKLDYGDYSFTADGRDFSLSCVVERKANVDELYTNIMSDLKDRKNGLTGRFEKELYAGSQLSKSFTIVIENIANWGELKDYKVPDWRMDANPLRCKKDIGEQVYATLRAWTAQNRYNASIEFVKDKAETADRMLDLFYYYWRSYKEMTGARRE